MKCPHYDTCCAPICPHYKDGSLWYPEEDICKWTKANQCQIVKTQRKIKKKCTNDDGYFTPAMLDINCMVKKGIKGLDPDAKNQWKKELQWIKAHPPVVKTAKQLANAKKLAKKRASVQSKKSK